VLVWVGVPVLCALGAWRLVHAFFFEASCCDRYLLEAVAISVAFALLAWSLKAATPTAAACGGVICFLLTDAMPSRSPSLLISGLPPLIVLFVLTFLATRYSRAKKESRGVGEPRAGRRTSQVIANLGIAALCAAFSHNHFFLDATFAFPAAIAALAEATADTLSSEVGQAIGGPAFLITTFRRVSPGTDGAISFAGTLSGLLGAGAVVLTVLIGLRYPLWGLMLLYFASIFTAAIAGLLFDSLLGATLERRGYLGNDLVNFLSTAFAAAILYPLGELALSFLHL
jgi:uncharacterized protein (TIGR00297 family)